MKFAILKDKEVKTLKNLFVRSLSIGARFLLIFNLSQYHGDAQLGEFGVFNSAIVLAVLLVGFDIYNIANRDIILSQDKKPEILFNQFIFYGITYIVSFAPLLLLFYFQVIPFSLISLFYTILVCEHLSQELYRIMIVLRQPVEANIALFIRSGLWVIFLLLHQFILSPSREDIGYIYFYWLGGVIVCLIYSLSVVRRHVNFSRQSLHLDKTWLRNSIKISGLYFLSTISYNLILYGNRFIINYYRTKEEVGIYTFFNQMANLINVIVFTTIIMEEYPGIVRYINEKDPLLKKKITLLSHKILLFSAVMGLLLAVCAKPAFLLIGKQVYADEIFSLYVLIIANIALNASFSYHYVLYGYKKDSLIVKITCISLLIYIAITFIGVYAYGLAGAALAVLASCLALLLMKRRAAFTLIKRND